MSKTQRLTPSILNRLIREEKKKLNETLELGLKHPSEAPKRTKEVKAEKLSGSLESHMNFYKACCIKEEALKKQLKKIQEAKKVLKKKMIENLD